MRELYSFDQIKAEVLRVGKGEETDTGGLRCDIKEYRKAITRLKMRGTDPAYSTFEDVLKQMRTPWGKINEVYKLTDGIYSVSTPGHGGLWLSDKWKAKLPKSYKPFTRNKRWAEEDEDAAIVLQHLGLLSLFDRTTPLEITAEDIKKGYDSRLTFYDKPYFSSGRKMNGESLADTAYRGGPIQEAYNRTFQNDVKLNITENMMSERPGGWKVCKMPTEATAFMKQFDAGEDVKPIRLTFYPYIYIPIKNRPNRYWRSSKPAPHERKTQC